MNSDDLIDLAVLGPIDTDLDPLDLYDGEHLANGSNVFLVGYPVAIGGDPLPTITSGLLSGVREWEAISMTYLETDAVVTREQVGGALVSDRGKSLASPGSGLATPIWASRLQQRIWPLLPKL